MPFLLSCKSCFFRSVTYEFISAFNSSRALKLVNSLGLIDLSSTFITDFLVLFIYDGGLMTETPFFIELFETGS